ncbi:hypothetical protein PPTG_20085 [Phytophthora nicotianae INRA-310]|uniref:PX domain-containing protein n=1 Tax=Phytophthora nicotianae (strain INRA-310) TaxID=761204 RepID=W2PA83_PHYN3|nr:hypothetical protein PPTG_20085 [Phytophthora nicotianae INRA-310]ETM97731.1 hypothetical protein PPTG_20085 [Phytophthora nicotianae INRA-310]
MELQSSHTPLQRHPKCSALYASRLRHDPQASKPTESLAPSVAYLANVTVEVTTKTLTRDASTFALTVHDKKSSSTWRHLRSYSECRAFQTRVLKLLSRGHLCFAECPWLYASQSQAPRRGEPAPSSCQTICHFATSFAESAQSEMLRFDATSRA